MMLQQFKEISGYDIEKFFEDFVFFTQNHYQSIVNYYNGSSINRDSFNYLEYLNKESNKIESLIDQYSNTFNTSDFWDLCNNFSEIQTKLETCNNMGRWLRSSRISSYSPNVKIQHIQKQNETIEKIANDAGFSDQDEWANIALDNKTIEEDYTNTGGKLLNVSLPISSTSDIDNIVDYLIGKNILGKDIEKKIEIQSDGGLSTLEYEDSLNQTTETIFSTMRGSIPEFPDDGIPNDIFGTNENIIQYPIVFRSLLNMIQKDKRFVSLEVLDINKQQDSIFMDFQLKTITGETFTNNITV